MDCRANWGIWAKVMSGTPVDEAINVYVLKMRLHQAQRRKAVNWEGLGPPNEGMSFKSDGQISQETGCSRKVEITKARELDMMIRRHSFLDKVGRGGVCGQR